MDLKDLLYEAASLNRDEHGPLEVVVSIYDPRDGSRIVADPRCFHVERAKTGPRPERLLFMTSLQLEPVNEPVHTRSNATRLKVCRVCGGAPEDGPGSFLRDHWAHGGCLEPVRCS